MPTQREWTTIREYEDILFDYYNGIARITINRERYRNAFTPTTTAEMSDALRICREEADIDVIVITGAGDKAFCSGGDQNVKGRGGYIGKDGVPRLSVLDVQKQIRSIPKPVIAAVNGFAIGGGHVLHVVCDLSIASENAIFGQTGPRVGSFDAGFGASYLARVVGQKKAREIWFLCRKYNAQEALDMGLVNKVVPLEQLEDEYVQWAEEMMLLSPLALRMIKAGLNAELDGQAGIQELAGDDVNIIFGAMYDDSVADYARITVIATGLSDLEAKSTPFGNRSNTTPFGVRRPAAGTAGTTQTQQPTMSMPSFNLPNMQSTPTFTSKVPSSTVQKKDIQIPDFLKNR